MARLPAIALVSLLLLAALPVAMPAAQAASTPAPPSEPLGLAADGRADRAEAVLSWQAPQEPGKPHFNRYDVLRGADGATPTVVATVASNVTAFTDGGLSPGVVYTYQVQAASRKATGPASQPVTVQLANVPSTPRGLTAELLGDLRIHLQWTLPEATGDAFAGFRLYRASDGQEPAPYLTTDGTEYYDGIEGGHTYVYQVSALNGAGEGPRSEPVSVATGPGAPSAPLGLQAVVDRDAQDAILAWQPPADDGGAPIIQYDVVMSVDGSGLVWVGSVPGDVLTFTDADYQFGPAYTYYVQASNGAGVSPFSDGAFVQETSVPSAPYLSAEPIDDHRIHLQWTLPEVIGGSPFTGFRLYRAFAGEEPALYLESDGIEYYDGVETGRAYTYQVSAVNGVGEGPRSAPVTAMAVANVVAIGAAAGATHTCILLADGNVDCYGDDSFGQAADYTAGDAAAVAAGWRHTCVLTTAGNVDCHGSDDNGQLLDRFLGDAVAVAAGESFTCILLASGDAECAGYDAGQVGGHHGGDAVAVAVGDYHACYLLSSGNVDCQGGSYDGRADDYLGGDAVGLATGSYHTCILLASGNVDCRGLEWAGGETADYLGGDAVGVAASNGSTCVLKESGEVLCFGYRAADAAGVTATAIDGGLDHLCALHADGTVDCFGWDGYGQATDFPYPPAAPSAPRFVTAQPGTNGQSITVSWVDPATAGGSTMSNYRVYRGGADAGPEALLAVLPPWQQSYEDAGLPAGQVFHYRVSAVNAGGESPWSEAASATSDAGAPWQVGSPSIQYGATPTQAILSWEAPDDGGLPITEYRIQRGAGPTSWEAEAALAPYASVDGATFALAEAGLERETYYAYTVTAVNEVGEGPASWTASILAFAYPGAVGQASAEWLGDPAGTVRVTWEAPADGGGPGGSGSDGLYYYVYRSDNGGEPMHVHISDVGATEYVDTWYHVRGASYTYWVAAVNSHGPGPLSPEASVVLPDVPSAPLGLAAAEGPGAGEVTLTWQPPASDGGAPVLNYRVYRYGYGWSGSDTQWSVVAEPTGTSFVDAPSPAPSAQQTYLYYVSPVNGAGEGYPSDTVQVGGSDPGPAPSPPAGLAAAPGPGPAQVTLTWQAPADVGGSPVDGYLVHRLVQGPEGPGEWSPAAWLPQPETLSWTDAGLDASGAHRYFYAVSAQNAGGDSGFSDVVEGVPSPGEPTVDPVAPSAPQGLAAAAGPGVGEVTLAWQPPADDGGATVTLYEVYAGGFLVGMTQLGDGDGFLSFTDTGLAPGETRSYSVAAHNVAGTGPRSEPASASAFDTPSAPLGVAAAATVLYTDVSWQAPADDGGLPVLSYTVYRSVDGAEPVPAGYVAATEHAFRDDGCALLHSCEYRVTATSLVGEGDLSEGATVLGTSLPRLPA